MGDDAKEGTGVTPKEKKGKAGKGRSAKEKKDSNGNDVDTADTDDGKASDTPVIPQATRRTRGEKKKRMRSESTRENPIAAKKAKKRSALEREVDERLEALTKRQAQADEYLKKWKENRATWKYSTVVQSWLLKHAFDRKIVPKSMFSNFLVPYLRELKGGAVTRLKASCEEVTSAVENGGNTLAERVAALEKKGNGSESVQRKIKILRARYKRAHMLNEICDAIETA